MVARRADAEKKGPDWGIYLLIIPAVVLLIALQFYPFLQCCYLSFCEWSGKDAPRFIGFDNFSTLWRSTEFWQTYKVVIAIALWNVVKMAPALIVAVAIHHSSNQRIQTIYRGLFVVVMGIPALVIVLVWRSYFFHTESGYLNQLLISTGILDLLAWCDTTFAWGGIFRAGQPPAWLGDPQLMLAAVVICGFPWVGSVAVLTYLAKLDSLPREVYESVTLEGANWWTTFTRLELPFIMTSINVQLILVIIGTVKDAATVLLLAGPTGGSGGTVLVPALLMLRFGFQDGRIGLACAIGILLALTVVCLQRIGTLVLEWESLRPWQRLVFRLSMFALALCLLCSGIFELLAYAILILIAPYDAIRQRAELFTRSGAAERRELGGRSRRRQFQRERERTPGSWGKAGDLLLRICKHGTIWSVLALAFLPLYLMLVVSAKTNRQFQDHPVAVTQPLHWSNWSEVWKSIGPAVQNSIFIATVSTFLTVCLAVGAAYYCARHGTRVARFVWGFMLFLLMVPGISSIIPLFCVLRDFNMINTLTALVFVSTSAGLIVAAVVLKNFIEDISAELFDAAAVDGASHLRQILVIVLPLSGPILIAVGIMHFMDTWEDFIVPLIVMRDQDKLPIMVALVRLAGEYVPQWGPLMAGYALGSLPLIVLLVFSMKLFLRGMREKAEKI